MICDNTNHIGNPTKPEFKVYQTTLTKDFESERCNWCYDCIRRDMDMILEIKNYP